MEKAIVFNIQKFSLHDGEGIRTTIFFKGCGLSCLWCHNPESQTSKPQLMRYEERCTKCGACVKACPHNALSFDENNVLQVDYSKCITCGICVDHCAYDALEIAGKEYTADELVNEAKKDIILYEESGGGVTLSGGEVMVQPKKFLLSLVKKLNRLGINVAIDTCGFAPWETFEAIAPYVNTILYDLKTIDEKIHDFYIGKGLDVVLSNLIKLDKINANINIRIPIIEQVNAKLDDMEKVADFLTSNKIKVKQINILPYHKAGTGKYERLGLVYKDDLMSVPSNEKMEEIKSLFEEKGYNVIIGG